jgi:hypothetical protein
MRIFLFLLSSFFAQSLAFSPTMTLSARHNVASSTKRFLSTKTEVKEEDSAVDASKEPLLAQYTDSSLNNLQKTDESSSVFSYVEFAKTYPFANNIMIASAKTAAADLLAQTVIAQTPLMDVDLQRSFLFCMFGAIYLGAFQYLYQVQVRLPLSP